VTKFFLLNFGLRWNAYTLVLFGIFLDCSCQKKIIYLQVLLLSRDSSVGIALGYGLDDRGSRVRFPTGGGLGIFLFTIASRTTLRPTQPYIQWVSGALSLGVKRPGCEADHSYPSSAEVKEWMELYLHSPILLHGVELS
jgi:hypothetical protein